MKLTTHKKIILWGGSVFLFVEIFVIILVSKGSSKKVLGAPLPEHQTELNQAKSQTFAGIQNSSNEKNNDLKKQQILKSDETYWKSCFNSPEVNSASKLGNFKKKCLTITNNLSVAPIPIVLSSPHPTLSSPTQPLVSGSVPENPPTDQWEKILWEIRKFFNTNPTSLREMKEWVKKQNYPNPLTGVDLKGASADQLKLIPDRGPVPNIEKDTSVPAYRYKDYVQLSAIEDGNCFLNSFSVLLTGKANDTSLTMRLKVKLSLEFIITEGFTGDGANVHTSQFIKEKVNDSKYGFAKPGAYLENVDIIYMAPLRERPIAVVSTTPTKPEFGEYGDQIEAYEYPKDFGTLTTIAFPSTYKESWVIYNSGGHFQPLANKNK